MVVSHAFSIEYSVEHNEWVFLVRYANRVQMFLVVDIVDRKLHSILTKSLINHEFPYAYQWLWSHELLSRISMRLSFYNQLFSTTPVRSYDRSIDSIDPRERAPTNFSSSHFPFVRAKPKWSIDQAWTRKSIIGFGSRQRIARFTRQREVDRIKNKKYIQS